MTEATLTRKANLQRPGLWLERFTVACNGVEAFVAVGVGLVIGSVALVGFGVDSGIEGIPAVALLIGLGTNALFGLWWANPLGARITGGVAIKEGRESWRGESCCTASLPEGSDCEDACCE